MQKITLLDGGMGEELLAQSGADPGPLWATQIMIDQPDLVGQIHEDYFAVGASLATVNSYNILHDRLAGTGQEDKFAALHRIALEQAQRARRKAGRGLLAGSMGPLGESYRPDLTPEYEVDFAQYSEKARLLVNQVDIILIETMPSIALAKAAVDAVRGLGRPIWLSVCLTADSLLLSGESLAGLKDLRPDAILANCAPPEVMGKALAEFKTFGLPFGAYANGFTPAQGGDYHRHDLTPQAYSDFALSWVRGGATLVGGCCGIGPAHIRHLAQTLGFAGYDIL